MSFVVTRQQLYDLVWSEPMQRLAKQIGISDVALSKACRKIDVPVPERGYWNKLQAGKRVVRVALATPDLATVSQIEISGSLPESLQSRIHGDPCVEIEEDVTVLAERFAKRLGNVVVPRNFDRAHPLIAKLLAKDEEVRKKKLTEQFFWGEPQFDTPFEQRRLRILSSLYSAFSRVGSGGWMRGPNARELSVSIGNSSISFTLDRPTAKRDTRYGYSPTTPDKGEPSPMALAISAYQPPAGITFAWQDEPGRPLERHMTEVVVGMAVAAEHLHREGTRRHNLWLEERRQEEVREAARLKTEAEIRERERLAGLEKARIEALLTDAQNLDRSARLRRYVEIVVERPPAGTSADDLKIWAAYVRSQADALDPLTSGRLQASMAEAIDSQRVQAK